MKRIVEETQDGSATLFVPELDEHYHSTKGALTESRHIFIEMGLKASGALSPRILEVGFGTGLNAFLTLQYAEEKQRTIHYTGIELYPLSWEEVAALNYSRDPLFKSIHDAPWDGDIALAPHSVLRKVHADVNQYIEECADPAGYDVVYFDAFAPEKQPEMWSEQLFSSIYKQLNPEGILTTYCAKGVIRRLLQKVGFQVERLPGPPGGKREILRGTKCMV